MSAARARSGVEASRRSIHPQIAGVPWWGALLLALTATALGYAIDAGMGHKELTAVFAGLYVAGCVIAVLAVRQSGVFTTVIQPPLILFCAVPGAYLMFHGGTIGKFKDLLINCGYPLIERFPLMVGTAGGVLLIGVVRWYLGSGPQAARKTSDDTDVTKDDGGEDDAPSPVKAFFGGIAAKLAGVAQHDSDEQAQAPRARAADRSSRTGRPARADRSGRRPARNGSRPSRELPGDDYDPAAERPRRQSARRQPTARDYNPVDAADPADPPRRAPRRRPRPQGEPDPRAQQTREGRRESYGRRNPYEWPGPEPRNSRFDPYDRYDPDAGQRRSSRPRPYDDYEAREPREPRENQERPRRRARSAPDGDSTHHPISQVRYRDSGPREERAEREEQRDEPRGERRNRSRSSGRSSSRHEAENWEYDV